ncbi:MAG TPA: tetratricopeptide repeat protein, partial [Desulfurivibrionaceae bacterium]|nr:tetratricopeptide repeat protein [Desulfurivibrionaceae bacterium]
SFAKAQLPVNCRKALRHAEFFGPASQVIFDAVSCNISGDVSYNGGDLPKAVREYRLGLAMDPANVNLLNSLGVAYTQLMRPRMAQQCFEAALRHDKNNFMALFNVGFLHLHRQETAKALDCFERALASNDHHFDLLLQLGRLYCGQKRFAEAAKLLGRCVADANLEERRNGDRAAAWRLLGEARAGLGENKKAILAFQKALSFSHRDAQALSMLGELYAKEKEGDEIALSLCQEAVALDGGQGEHWRRLAWVQWSRGEADAAIASLKHCLQLDRKNPAALFWLARIYREQGRFKEAHRLYEKVLRLQPNHAEARSALAQVRQ